MCRYGFLFLLNFSSLFLCKGEVFPPPNGNNVTFLPGSTEKIVWSFNDDIKSFSRRLWTFTPSDGRPQVALAKIEGDGNVEIFNNSYDVALEKPATLVLKNVTLAYNGTYEFLLAPNGVGSSKVVVYIAVKPNATASRNRITVNEGDNVSCVCQGQGGNPPADVTWYKDNRKIGGTKKEENTLSLTNVTNEKHHGSYKCVAQSYPKEKFQDEVIVEVIVKPNYKPRETKIKVPEEAYVGGMIVINCSSDGLPAPSFTITHNVTTNIVSNQSWYIKEKVDYSDGGLYECIAKNFLGNDADSGNLIVKEKRPSTKSTPQKSTTQSTPGKTTEKRPSTKSTPKKSTTQSTPGKTTVRTKDNGGGGSSAGLSTGAKVGICVAVLLVVVIIVVYMCRWYTRNEKDGRNRRNEDNESSIEIDNGEEALAPLVSGSKRSTPEKNALPPVYAAVDKENRQGNPLYATVDTDAMNSKRESKKQSVDRAPQTVYERVNFRKTAKAAKLNQSEPDYGF